MQLIRCHLWTCNQIIIWLITICVCSMYAHTWIFHLCNMFAFCLLVVGEQTKQSKTLGATFVWKKLHQLDVLKNFPSATTTDFVCWGWLRAQNPSGEMRFLPMEISGVLVLSRTGAEQQREAENPRVESLGINMQNYWQFWKKNQMVGDFHFFIYRQ